MMREVIVTGGSSGIGAAVAGRFRAGGDRVTIVGRDEERLRRVAGEIEAGWQACDLCDADAVERLASLLPGKIDVVVAMAGGTIDPPNEPELSPSAALAEQWAKTLRANTISTALTIEALLPRIRSGGSIITVSSIGAEYASGPYGASKAAIAAWMSGLSAQVGPSGITANAIAPGYIEDTAFFGDTMTEERRARLISSTHTKRAGRPEDVAGLAWFLAGPDARQITGQTVHVNGGAHTTR